ncbi:hypothetical protein [Nocardiopsis ansamitocini]|uniref:hypothetical protein n=1 Tax=Nocardiopsis ansamitocini TaxID=1670832 RepID=UPI002553185E|nr:hypothetical protein [Nocardiopsis ansamitocini]
MRVREGALLDPGGPSRRVSSSPAGRLRGHRLHSPRTDVWLRVLDHGDAVPLPEGARVLMSRTVVCGAD